MQKKYMKKLKLKYNQILTKKATLVYNYCQC